jgi:hypothetical protein
MELKLKFHITLVDGGETEQEISVPADPKHPVEKQMLALMQAMFNQYAQVGMLKEHPKGTFTLLCPSQIMTIQCELPSLIIANANEVPKVTLE